MWNFVVEDIFIWNHLRSENSVLRLMILKYIFFSNNLGNDLSQSYSTKKIKYFAIQSFYLILFRISNMHYNIHESDYRNNLSAIKYNWLWGVEVWTCSCGILPEPWGRRSSYEWESKRQCGLVVGGGRHGAIDQISKEILACSRRCMSCIS